MKTHTITAQKRTELGTQKSRQLIRESLVPGVLYGGKKIGKNVVHFFLKAIDIRSIDREPCFIDLLLEKETIRCILQAQQFHPVSGIPIHVDLLAIADDQNITMRIPVKLIGNSVGVSKGGLLIKKIRKMHVKALPSKMPEHIEVDVSHLDLGKTVKVSEVTTKEYAICNQPSSLVAAIEIPRALRSKGGKAAAATAEGDK
jgi:large subunit ribosomal protein L25